MKSLLASLLVILITFSAQAAEKDAKPWETWDKFRAEMIRISDQLGVTCTYCHQPKNYRDGSKKEYQIAKKHMEMVDLLQKQFKDTTNNKTDCYLCHRGQAKIELKKKN